jgi:hypothetical protein
MKKGLAVILTTMALSVIAAGTVFAGTWKQDSIGWKYQNSDGSYQSGKWFQDTTGKYYYFGNDGYMLSDTITPDGYKVDVNGVWIQNTAQYTNAELNQAYLAVINGIRQEYGADGDSLNYAVVDLDNNGVAELVIQHGRNNYDKTWLVYSYDGTGAVEKANYEDADMVSTSALYTDPNGSYYLLATRWGCTSLYKVNHSDLSIAFIEGRNGFDEGYTDDPGVIYDMVISSYKLTKVKTASLTSTELLPQ